jgi:hypothetical protein
LDVAKSARSDEQSIESRLEAGAPVLWRGEGGDLKKALPPGERVLVSKRLQFQTHKLMRRGRISFGILSVLLVLLLDLLAAAPALHERFHADAPQTAHQCAVTLFAHGQVDVAAVDVAVAVVAGSVQLSPRLEFSVFSPAIGNLPPGRAPPAAVSSPV